MAYRVLIIGYTGLGNFILKEPMISKIKALDPTSVVDVLIGEKYGVAEIANEIHSVDNVIFLSERGGAIHKLAYFWSLRKHEYDAVLVAFDVMRVFVALGLALLGGKKTVVHYRMIDFIG